MKIYKRKIIFEPSFTVALWSNRPVKIYLKGEVQKPGLYEFLYETSQASLNSNNKALKTLLQFL